MALLATDARASIHLSVHWVHTHFQLREIRDFTREIQAVTSDMGGTATQTRPPAKQPVQ